MKKFLSGEPLIKKAKAALDKTELVVGTALGPTGRNVALDRGFEKIIVHDGVTILDNFALQDEFENFFVDILRQAARSQVDLRGDGTTVTTILACSIARECFKLTDAGYNAMLLEKGLIKSVNSLLTHLDSMKTEIKTEADKIKIATISSNSEELGEKIGKIIHKLGDEGIIDVEESKSTETTVEHQEGMQFDQGFASGYFMTDLKRREATVESPYILISDKPIDNINEIMPFTQKLVGRPAVVDGVQQMAGGVTRNVVMIAPSFSNDMMGASIATKAQGIANVLLINAPFSGEVQKNFLKDLAILTGGTVVGNELGTAFETMEVSVCGHAKRVTSTVDATKIVGGEGDPNILAEHIKGLRKQLEDEEGAFNQEKFKERIGKLTTGVAVIKVGGKTEVEIRDRKEWTDDAINSTKAAITGGIVPGGEMALFNLSLLSDKQFASEQAAKILKLALKKPFKKLLENAGIEYAEIWTELREQGVNSGVDVIDGKVKDMVKSGIIDPALVVKSALENALSIALKIVTTDCAIVEEFPKKKD